MDTEYDYTKYLQFILPPHIHYKFINRIEYYDLSINEVGRVLIEMFNDGLFDEIFSIPKD